MKEMEQAKIRTYLDMIRAIPPQLPAISVGDRVWTYGELAEAAEHIRREQELTQMEMPPAAHSLFVIRDHVSAEANCKNTLSMHQTSNPISHIENCSAEQSSSILQSLISFLALSGTKKVPVIIPADAQQEGVSKEPKQHAACSDCPACPVSAIPPEACMAVMTSGTTGAGHLLFRTFESWYDYFSVQNEIFSMGRDCRIFMQGSLAFTGNFNLCMAQLSAGGTVLAEKIFDPRLWMRRIEAEHATAIYLIPTKLRALRSAYAKAGIINPYVRTIISGSQSLGKPDAEALKAVFPNAEIILYYGASELSYITYIKDQEMGSDQTLIGRPFPGVEVQASDGRLLVTTRYGVIGTPDRDAFIGDYGHCDDRGMFYFDGRKDDLCNISGRKVSSWRVEQALLGLDGVAEAAVKPVFLDERNQLAAWVVLHPGAEQTKIQLREALLKKLPAAEIPKYITFVTELPKTDSGKIRKGQINVPVNRKPEET